MSDNRQNEAETNSPPQLLLTTNSSPQLLATNEETHHVSASASTVAESVSPSSLRDDDPICTFMNPFEGKIFKTFKALQFFLTTFYFCSWFVPNHDGFLAILTNPGLATTLTFVMSGMLTHIRYRPLLDNTVRTRRGDNMGEDLSILDFSERFSIYTKLRIGLLAPIWGFAVFISVFAGVPSLFRDTVRSHAFRSLWNFIKAASGFSAILDFAPYYRHASGIAVDDIAHNEYVPNPSLIIGSSLAICWLVYPVIVFFVLKIFSVRSAEKGMFDSVERTTSQKIALISSIVTFGLILPWVQSFSLKYSTIADFIHLDEDYKYHGSLIGASIFYLNPIFKLSQFITGVLLAEEASLRGWLKCDNKSDSAQSAQDIKDKCPKMAQYLIGVFWDITVLIGAIVCNVNLSNPKQSLQFLNKYVLKFLPTSIIVGEKSFGIISSSLWKLQQPLFCLPFICVVYFLAMHPFAHRSLTAFVLHQMPLQGVLAGRVAVIIGLFSFPVLRMWPEKISNQFYTGKGLFMMLFSIFVTSIPFYYYVYQPIQIFISAKVSLQLDQLLRSKQRFAVLNRVLNQANNNNRDEHDMEQQVQSHDDLDQPRRNSLLKLGFSHTPQYDPLDLKDASVDRTVHIALSNLSCPSFLEDPKSYPIRITKFIFNVLFIPPKIYGKEA